MTEQKQAENREVFDETAEKLADRFRDANYAERELGAVLVELGEMYNRIEKVAENTASAEVVRVLIPIRSRLFDLSVPAYRAKLVKQIREIN